jgi:hypothetical protein
MARQAHSDPRGGPSRADQVAAQLVRRLVDSGIDGVGRLAPAREVAEAARTKARSTDDAVADVVRRHTRLVAASGFVTGLGGFVTMPVALPANVVGFYVVATRMVAAIAHLRGYDLSRDEVRSAVLLALVGADADDLLKKAGLSGAGGLRGLALQRLPAPALMVVNKAIGFRLLAQVGKRGLARLGRSVPLAGGVLGAGFDAWWLRRIAKAAREEFPERHGTG